MELLIKFVETQEIGRVHHRRINIEEATGTGDMNSKKKWEYFSKRLETMWGIYLECMEHLNAKFLEEWKVCHESSDGQQYEEYLREIEFPYRNTLNSAMLIAFCSLTEHVVADIANENVPEYEKKKESKKGDWLVRNIELLNKHGFDVDLNDEDVRLFSYYIKIRNCVVHNGGRISNSKYLGQLKEAINAVKKYAQSGNYIMIKIKDDHLVLGGDLISDVVLKSEDIIDGILEQI